MLLLLDDIDLHLFSLHKLARLVLLQIVSQVRFGLLLIHRRLVLGDVRLVIPLGLGNPRIRYKLRFLPRLDRLGRFDHRIAIGLGLGDLRVAFDLGDPRLAQCVEVALAVLDVPDGEADNAQAHVGHVARRHLLDLLGEGVPVLVNVFHRHRAQNRAQMPFQRLHGDVLDGLGVLAQELLGGGGDRDVVTLHLDLRHAIHAHRHAFAGVDVLLLLHVDGQQLQRQPVHFLDDRNDEGAAAFPDSEAACLHSAVGVRVAMRTAGDDKDLVRADLDVAAGPNRREDHDDNDHADGHYGDASAQAAQVHLGEKEGIIWHR